MRGYWSSSVWVVCDAGCSGRCVSICSALWCLAADVYSKARVNWILLFFLSFWLVRHDDCEVPRRCRTTYLCGYSGRLCCVKHVIETQPFVHLPVSCFIGCHCRHLTWRGPLEGQMHRKAYILQHLGVILRSLPVALGNLPQDSSPPMEDILHLEGMRQLTRDTQAAPCQASPRHRLVSSRWAFQDSRQHLTQGSSPCQIIHQAQLWTHLCPLTQELLGLPSLP